MIVRKGNFYKEGSVLKFTESGLEGVKAEPQLARRLNGKQRSH